MELHDKIRELLQDNKSRTSKEIHKDLILSKKHFFTVNNPLPGITRCCNLMVKDNTLSLESRQGNKKSYLIPPLLEVLELEKENDQVLENDHDQVLENDHDQVLEKEKNDFITSVIKYEEERNRMAEEEILKKYEWRNSIIIALLSLGAFAFNYWK